MGGELMAWRLANDGEEAAWRKMKWEQTHDIPCLERVSFITSLSPSKDAGSVGGCDVGDEVVAAFDDRRVSGSSQEPVGVGSRK